LLCSWILQCSREQHPIVITNLHQLTRMCCTIGLFSWDNTETSMLVGNMALVGRWNTVNVYLWCLYPLVSSMFIWCGPWFLLVWIMDVVFIGNVIMAVVWSEPLLPSLCMFIESLFMLRL
jgi:hypothetical protein